MNQTKQNTLSEDWEKRFDEKWNRSFLGTGFDSVEGKRKTPIKEFIADEIAKQKAEMIEEIELSFLPIFGLVTGLAIDTWDDKRTKIFNKKLFEIRDELLAKLKK